jgi:hypothetical protein
MNAFKNVKEREEKEARVIACQLVKDLKKVNPVMKKSLIAYTKSIGTTLKKNVSIMLKARKALIKARVLPKSLVKRLVKALIKEVVVLRVIKASVYSRTIRLP